MLQYESNPSCGEEILFIFAATCLPRFPSDQRAQGKPFIFTPYMSIGKMKMFGNRKNHK